MPDPRDSTQTSSEDGLGVLFSANPLPMWLYDLETLAFIEVNDAAIARYGYSREEFLRMRITDIRPKTEAERLLENVKQPRPVLQYSGDWQHRLRDGRLIDVDITSHTVDFRGRAAALVVVHDVTARNETAAALRRSEARKAAILESTIDGILTLDARGAVTELNPAAERMFRAHAADAIGRPLGALIAPPAAADRPRAAFSGSFADEKAALVGKLTEVTAVRSDGVEFPVEVAITETAADGPPTFTVVVRDISERRQAEEARVQMAAEVETQRMRVFKATMTTVHDIVNNFLTTCQLIRMEAEGRLPAESLTLFDELIRDTSAKLKTLADLQIVREREMEIGTGIEYEE